MTKAKKKILFCDGASEETKNYLEAFDSDYDFEFHEAISRTELEAKIPDVHVLAVRTRTHIDAPLLQKAKNLKLIARAGVGLNHIDLKKAEALGIKVVHTAGASSYSVADLSLGLLMSAARDLPRMHEFARAGEWASNPKARRLGIELCAKTAGILGMGRIGRLVSLRFQAFGMKVIACDPYRDPQEIEALGAEPVDFTNLMNRSQILSLHVPLTDETRDLINAESLRHLPPGAILINTARGPIVNERDVFNALQSGILQAYAADVFGEEPLNTSAELAHHPRVILSPHSGAYTVEAQSKLAKLHAEQILTFLKTGLLDVR